MVWIQFSEAHLGAALNGGEIETNCEYTMCGLMLQKTMVSSLSLPFSDCNHIFSPYVLLRSKATATCAEEICYL